MMFQRQQVSLRHVIKLLYIIYYLGIYKIHTELFISINTYPHAQNILDLIKFALQILNRSYTAFVRNISTGNQEHVYY
jgi:hypothetical protein